MSQVFEVFRYDNPDGSTKDWAISRNPQGGYTKCWGKTGTRMQTKAFTGNQIEPEKSAKRNKGYRAVGTAVLDQDGKLDFSAVSRSAEPEVEEAPTPARIHYRIAVKNDAPSATQKFRELTLETLDRLIEAFPEEEKLPVLKSTYQHRPISNEGGQLAPDDGVDALIFFMAIMAKSDGAVKVSLAHDDGVAISFNPKLEAKAFAYFDSDLESNRQVLEAVGLLLPRLDFTSIQSEVADYFF